MTASTTPKLLPRNVAALRAGQVQKPNASVRTIAGNSVATRLESRIGNFFPGLECDLRNLERRFFPFLEVEANFTTTIVIVGVDAAGLADAAARGAISAADLASYQTIEGDLSRGARWSIESMTGDFGPLGALTVTLSQLNGGSFGAGRLPPDAWTAIRLLKESADVTLKLTRPPGSAPGGITLTAPRARYLDENGALARMFVPGELTQSLCSPWTHDFRDCACFYWASNHPDIALPPLPDPSVSPNDTRLGRDTAWERADRSLQSPPVATARGNTTEIDYHEISRDWQLLNFVVERRERVTPYIANPSNAAAPLANDAALLAALRYAAGVELGVMLQYLSAAWSLKKPNALLASLRDDVTSAFAEIRRIAIGEMRHLRAVNDVISQLALATPYQPALAIASDIPDGKGGFIPLQFQPANPATIQRFLDIEAPSASSVDGLYAQILATLLKLHPEAEEQAESIRKIMSEGADHYQTFLFIQEWLGRHTQDSDYLISPASPPLPSNQAHKTLQSRYRNLLDSLFGAYNAGLPAGGVALNAARTAMLAPDGIVGALDAIAAQGFLPVFDPIADPRFAPVAHP
jgi:Ferritin-like